MKWAFECMRIEAPITDAQTTLAALPADVVEFHRQRSSEWTEVPGGRAVVDIRPFNKLTLDTIEVSPCTADFFLPRSDCLIVRTVPRLVVKLATISAGEYDAYRVLVWLPEIRRYAIWNSLDHSVGLFNERIRWREIVDMTHQSIVSKAEGELHVVPAYERTGKAADASRRQSTVVSLLRFRRPRLPDFAYYSLALVTLLVFGFMILTSELPAISPETFDQIEIGMKEHEVMRIVRASPGWYRGDNNEPAYIDGRYYYRADGMGAYEPLATTVYKGSVLQRKKHYTWASNDGRLIVEFDQNGAVSFVSLEYPPGRTLSHPEQWQWWKRLLNRETPSRRPAYFYFGSM